MGTTTTDTKPVVKDTGLRNATGPVKQGFTRVRVVRNHDGADDFYRKGEVVDVWAPYVESQITGTTADGHKFKVEPAVFELVK